MQSKIKIGDNMNDTRIYAAIDLKSFYASVECKERKLDPLDTNLVVADIEHSEKTICLAVSPSLKFQGISGRPRLFEVMQKVKKINQDRYVKNGCQSFRASSFLDSELKENDNLKLDFIIAKPQMALYMKYGTQVVHTYLKYVSEEDLFVYSIDEVFIDVTSYLKLYNMRAMEFVQMLVQQVFQETGMTATAGIGTNLYLAKVAMDIVAKHKKPDQNGVRIACLTEELYKKCLWDHTPLHDFWRVGKGYTKILQDHHMFTMGDVARCSLESEELLFNLFGINAEYLIDHAWGYEPCTIQDIKSYQPISKSLCSSQVLHKPYDFKNGRLIIKEMVDQLSLDLLQKGFVTKELTLIVGYDVMNLKDSRIASLYQGEIKVDNYGRKIPKSTRGVVHLENSTNSFHQIMKAVLDVYDRVVIPYMYIRKICITANKLNRKKECKNGKIRQFSLFDDVDEIEKQDKKNNQWLEKEEKAQKVFLTIQSKYGKNSILKGMNMLKESTMKERNTQIGGHKA